MLSTELYYLLSWLCPSQARHLLWGAVGLGIITLLSLLLWFFIKRSEYGLERRRQELERQREALREVALESTREEEMAELSVEERARREMSENVINLIREHPEDAVQALRTWVKE
jgi:flagellar biosynthesis/type III secretory pathway M-ring protein FliF/YscJ